MHMFKSFLEKVDICMFWHYKIQRCGDLYDVGQQTVQSDNNAKIKTEMEPS